MDEIDLRILKILRDNSRESLGNIAKELGVSKATISRRLAKMDADGYISGYTIVLNPSRVGLMRGIISLQVAGSALNSVIEELRKSPEIVTVARAFGDHALVCDVYTSSVDALYGLIQERILKIPNVHNVEVDILIDSTPINPDAPMDIIRSRLAPPK
ncbi:Lrp/AsnC family transcriptional regulator [Methanomassiliicoccus luminyensis]|uniref:Lrp/AsnC family transcriptional regulator n=1 Tax=Methanomassiliicoccus luminyensis TaxID=1080712 RepID=UPI00138AF871|nr:Lrp/AsnC family transcriptional regulator [Methanomassiliicoccus luminyensis]